MAGRKIASLTMSDSGVVATDSPGKDKEANWLPAPKGPLIMYMRLYWPKDAALDGQWKAPPALRVG